MCTVPLKIKKWRRQREDSSCIPQLPAVNQQLFETGGFVCPERVFVFVTPGMITVKD